VKTPDVPFMKEPAVADHKDTKPDAKADKPSGPLGRAAESGDPAVHQVLAELQTAVMNDDQDAQEAAQAELKKLGVE
jgi:hypothetical protein